MKSVSVLLAAMAALSLPVAACSGGGGGDDDDDGGFGDDGGTGTGTLRIIAALSVDPDGNFLANVNVADEQSTVVSGATVTLKTPDQGDVLLVEQPVGFGTYVIAPAGSVDYAAGFGLDVDGGADGNATGIGFDAPELTSVTAPQNQDTVPLNQDLTVTWAGRGADEHRLELIVNDYDSGWIDGDTGSEVILAAVLTTAATETLTVRRRKELDITSGRPGSVFTVELEDIVEPLGVQ